MTAPLPPPAGWYPDPNGGVGQRYWDGAQWTDSKRLSDWCYWTFLQQPRAFHSEVLVPVAGFLYVVVLMFMPSQWIRFRVYRHYWRHTRTWMSRKDFDARRTKEMQVSGCWLEAYMVINTAVLCRGVVTQGYDTTWHGLWAFIVCLVAVWRILEILTVTGEVIVRRIAVEPPATVVSLALYVVQAVAIFTIAAELVGADGFQTSDHKDAPQSWRDFLYMTWNSMATLGSSYPAHTGWARIIVAASNVASILLLTLLLGFAVSMLGGGRELAQPAGGRTSGATFCDRVLYFFGGGAVIIIVGIIVAVILWALFVLLLRTGLLDQIWRFCFDRPSPV
jgi:hypothetical protein